jgi:hypothetical protein
MEDPARMKISAILDYIGNGGIALPEFQRGYCRNSDQFRKRFSSRAVVSGAATRRSSRSGTCRRV